MEKAEVALITGGIIGALIGIGQLLAKGEPFVFSVAIGRSIVAAGLATSAFSILAWIPDAPFPLLVGASALVASLGTDGLTPLIGKLLGARIVKSKEKNDEDK